MGILVLASVFDPYCEGKIGLLLYDGIGGLWVDPM